MLRSLNNISKLDDRISNILKYSQPVRIEFDYSRLFSTTNDQLASITFVNPHEYDLVFVYINIVLEDSMGVKYQYRGESSCIHFTTPRLSRTDLARTMNYSMELHHANRDINKFKATWNMDGIVYIGSWTPCEFAVESIIAFPCLGEKNCLVFII